MSQTGTANVLAYPHVKGSRISRTSGVTVNAPYRYSFRTDVGLLARILRTPGTHKWERQIGDYK